MKILWMSRHKPLSPQLSELRRLFGNDMVVKQDSRPFDSAQDILSRFREGGYDDIVVVAPLSVLDQLCKLGLHPIWAQMETCSKTESEVTAAGRYYRFVEFRRVVKLELVTSPLTPRTAH